MSGFALFSHMIIGTASACSLRVVQYVPLGDELPDLIVDISPVSDVRGNRLPPNLNTAIPVRRVVGLDLDKRGIPLPVHQRHHVWAFRAPTPTAGAL